MADPISDAQIVGALKLVVRGSGPVLDALTETDPLGWKRRTHREQSPEDLEVPDGEPGGGRGVVVRLRDKAVRAAVERFYATEFPGTAAWESMGTEERSAWWVSRVGRFTTLVASVPGLGGVLADRLPVQDTLGTASQAMVLCAVARVHGVTDQTEQVRLLAHILSGRDVDRSLVEGSSEPASEQTEEPKPGRSAVITAARALWRYARVLRAISGELGKRPHGGFLVRLLGNLPVVGVAGTYLDERSGMKKAVKKAEKWLHAHPDVS